MAKFRNTTHLVPNLVQFFCLVEYAVDAKALGDAEITLPFALEPLGFSSQNERLREDWRGGGERFLVGQWMAGGEFWFSGLYAQETVLGLDFVAIALKKTPKLFWYN